MEASDAAKRTRDEAEKELAAASLFGRGAARRRLEQAEVAYQTARDALRDARDKLKEELEGLNEGQQAFERSERHRRAGLAGTQNKAHMDLMFAKECELVAAETDFAKQGHEAVAAEARARLTARAVKQDGFESADELDDKASSGSRP